MSKINKKLTEEVFSEVKKVDTLLEESAGLKPAPLVESLEERIKKRLTEDVHTGTEEVTSIEETATTTASTGLTEDEEMQVIEALVKEIEGEDTVTDPATETPGDPTTTDSTTTATTDVPGEGVVSTTEPLATTSTDTAEGITDAPGGPVAGTDTIATDTVTTPIAAPEDVDQLINSMVEPVTDDVVSESTMTDLGYKDAKSENLTGKVQLENVDVTKKTKLGDEDITGKVPGAKTSTEVENNGTGEFVSPEGQKFTDLKTNLDTKEFTKTTDVAGKTVKQPDYNKVVAENVRSKKALDELADQLVSMEEEVSKLRLENYKYKKVNAVLTLADSLNESTKEQIVKKFDECVSDKQVDKLYNIIAEEVKIASKPSLNEAVTKASKSYRFLGESYTATAEDDNSDLPGQKRKNFLMGIGNEDDLYNVTD